MMKLPSFLLFIAVFIFFFFTFSFSRSITFPHPHLLKSFTPKSNQSELANARSCSYTVIIKTSCSSVSYTRDQVSIAFGDAYGNEVYVKRLDDPHSGTFERCSTDTFQIKGPCTRDICYLYLLRSGSDGWKPESVKIYGTYTKTVTYYYNVLLPNGVWYGFNECRRASLSGSTDM